MEANREGRKLNECRVCGKMTDGKRLCVDCEAQVVSMAIEMRNGRKIEQMRVRLIAHTQLEGL